MPLWEYEDRDAYRERGTRRFGRQATQSAFTRLASGELRRRGYDPSVIPSLYRPVSDQPQQPRDEVSGSQQVQYLSNIQKYIREGVSPENAIARAKVGATGGETFATKGGEWTPKGQLALTSGEVSGDEPVEELVRGGYITSQTITGKVVDPRTVMPEAVRGLSRYQRRFGDPVAALGSQVWEAVAEKPAEYAAQGVREIEEELGGRPAPTRVRTPSIVRRGPVNPITAAFGNDQEMEKAQQVFEEAGLVRSIAAQLILDPLNLVPVVGFTHFDDLGKLTRAAIRSSGGTREAVMGAIKGNRAFRAAMEAMKAGEAGGSRLGREAAEGGAGALGKLQKKFDVAENRLGAAEGGAVPPVERPPSGPFTEGLEAPARSPEELARQTINAAPESFQPTSTSERIRAQVAAEGGEPPKLPPGGGDIGGGGVPVPSLIPGGRGPSKSMWRDIENAVTFGDVGRNTVEALSRVPGMKPLIRTLTTPSALARIDPAARAAVVYRRIESIQIGELSQRMADLERRFSGLWDEVGAPGTVRLADGTDVPFGDLATDVLADGTGFPVTSTQRQWILDSKRLVDDLAGQYESVTGEVIALGGADYWPRFTLDGEGRAYVKGRVGAKQSPVKKRLYQEQEDGIAAGVPYANPLESVRLYGQSIQKMVRDDLLKKVVLEDKIGKSLTITEGHRRAITNTRSAIKRLEEGGLELQDLGEYQRLSKKLERLVTARAKIGAAPPHKGQIMGTSLGPAFQRVTFNRQTLKTIESIIGPGLTGKPGAVLRAATYVAAVPRFVVTGALDVGHFFIQGLTLLASDSPSWARAVGESVRSMADPQHFRRFLGSPGAQRSIRYGVDMGGTEFTEVTRRSHILRRLPGAKQAATVLGAFPRGFETFIAAGKSMNFNSLADVALKAGEPESELYRIGNYVNTKLGTTNLLSLGLSTTQRQAESAFVFYSARYTRSLFGMVGWMFSKGVPARDAQKSIAGMLFAGATGYYGLARAAGLSHDEAVSRLNPAGVKSSKFMAIPIGGNEYGIGSGYRATLGFLGSLLQHDNWEFDSWEDAAKDNPMARYLRSRTSPTTGTLIDFIEGEDFMGRQVSVDDFMDDPSRLLDYSQDKFLPLNIEAIVEARGPTWQKLLAGGVETAGGRAFPRSSFELFQEAQEAEFQRLRSLGEGPYIDYSSYAQLREADTPAAEAIDESSAVVDAQERMERENRYRAQTPEQQGFKKLEETRQAQQAEQQVDDTAFSGGVMPSNTWQDNLRFRQREYFARREQIINDFKLTFKEGTAPPHSVNAAIEDYFSVNVDAHTNPMTNQTDWSAFFAAREAAMSGLTTKDRLRVVAYTRRYDTPTVLQFKQAQDTLRPYFNVLTDVWTRMREHPDLARYSSYDDWLTAQAEELTRLGVPANELQMRLSDLPAVSRIESAVGELRARYRVVNPNADAALVKWYGLIPIRMQMEPSGGRSRRRSRARESAVERSR